MTKFPQNYDSIHIVESVFCIYEYKPPIFCGLISAPNSFNPVDCAVNYLFKSGKNMFILTRAGGFGSCDPQYTLIQKAYPSFSYAKRINTRLFVKHDQADRHKCMIGRPGWDLIG